MASRLFTWCVKQRLFSRRHNVLLQTVATKFHEPDPLGGYDCGVKKRSFREKIKIGSKMFIPESKKFGEEMREKFLADSYIPQEPGDYEIPWKFNATDNLEEWVVTADSDHNEGYSRAFFDLGKNKTGLFHGYLDTKVPKDGKTTYAGYANIRGPNRFLSFGRSRPYDWTHYNTMMVRVRGDGRPYMMVVQMERYWDVQWFDQYHYPLYTRGGPYWQTEFIPLNKFFLASKGRIQTKQENLIGQLDLIKNVGVTLSDGVTGNFRLEIDYIGLYYDASLNPEFAYEMYETEPYKVHD